MSKKAAQLATEFNVTLETIVMDLADFKIEPHSWDAIVSIFCHLPPPLRSCIHQQVVTGLRPGGAFILEAYTPRQLTFKTGGPPTADLMMNLETLRQELTGLDIVHGVECDRSVYEGTFHHGPSAVVQVLAFKPLEFYADTGSPPGFQTRDYRAGDGFCYNFYDFSNSCSWL